MTGDRDRLLDLPTSACLLVLATLATGYIVVLPAIMLIDPASLPLFLTFVLLAFLASLVKLERPRTMMIWSAAINIAALLALGRDAAILVASAGAWGDTTLLTRRTPTPHQALFSISAAALSVSAADLLFVSMGVSPAAGPGALAAAIAAAVCTYVFMLTLLHASLAALAGHQPLSRHWHATLLSIGSASVAGASLGALAVLAAGAVRLWWVAAVALGMYLTYHICRVCLASLDERQRRTRETRNMQLATVAALALAIEARDRTSDAHIQRMQRYAEALGRAAGMKDDELWGVRMAVLLHDVGNLAVPEHILSKPGPLTYEEYEKVKIHPRLGAEIVREVPFPYPVASLIQTHHERWDGSGYPAGLKREEIPLGGRVLAIVDCFTASLANRPYRRARSYAEAVRLLRAGAGSAFDPHLVHLFLRLLPLEEPNTAVEERAAADPGTTTALQNIAAAQREAHEVFEVALALGSGLGVSETMARIDSKLGQLIPFSCCALFVANGDGSYECVHASGEAEELVYEVRVRSLDALAAPVPRSRDERRLQSVLVCPLRNDGEVFGALTLYHTAEGAYTYDHRRVLERVSGYLACVLNNSLVFERAQQASLTDPLTGLVNRRGMLVRLAQDLQRAERDGCQLSVLLIDMDGFKEINDRWGHDAGDRALALAGQIMQSTLRPYDLCARYAGDEFVITLWDCDRQQARRRSHELQAAVAAAAIDVGASARAPLAISVGAAVWPHDGATVEELLAAADKQMYADKKARKRERGHADGDPGLPTVAAAAQRAS